MGRFCPSIHPSVPLWAIQPGPCCIIIRTDHGRPVSKSRSRYTVPDQDPRSRFPIKIHPPRSSAICCDLLLSLIVGVECGVKVGCEDGGVSVIGGGAQLRTFVIIIINHQSSIINHQSSIINHQLLLTTHPSSTINHPSSTINHKAVIINHL